MESIDRFLHEKYETGEGVAHLRDLYEAYLCFCDVNDLEYATKVQFVDGLFVLGYYRKYHKTYKTPYFSGISIKSS